MRPAPNLARRLLLSASAAALLIVVPARAFPAARRPVPVSRARAELSRSRYQNGVDHYAGGRYTEAYTAFQDALRLDPGNRAARLAVARVSVEISRSTAAWAAPQPRNEEQWSVWYEIRRYLFLDFELGDAQSRLGELRAVQGRIAQLVEERKTARRLGREFCCEAELYLLSRRLSALSS